MKVVVLFTMMTNMFNDPFEYFVRYRNLVTNALAHIHKQPFVDAYSLLRLCGQQKRRVFVCGNGGSASLAEHFTCDHAKGVHMDTNSLRPNVVSLSSNMATITAIGNDIGFEKIFSKQLEFSNADSTDVLVVISASGNSPNVVNALEVAASKQMKTIGLVGFDGGKVRDLANIVIHVNSDNYGVVEDCHQMLMHSLAQALRVSEHVEGYNKIKL